MSASTLRAAPIVLGALLLGACSDSSGPGTTGRQVSFQLSTQGAVPAPAPGFSAALSQSETYVYGNDTLVINQVEVVLREIELNRVNGGGCVVGTADTCEELKAGPVLLDLPLGAGAARQFTVAVDTGSFDKIEFEIHKPESDPGDDQFLAQHPDFAGISLRVQGTFNGAPFTYTSDFDVEQEAALNPPLVVTETSGAAVTLQVDLSTWFVNSTGGAIDPASANIGGTYEGEVKSNIEASFHAFEDENHDGNDDNS